MKDIAQAVEKYRDLILDAERYIWKHPETGYRETKTSAYLEKKFEELGYRLTKAEDIPGFYTVLDTGKEGAEVLVLGELDSLVCPSHKEADKETGYVHACGHNIQTATLLGIAAALTETKIKEKLSGRIRLCAVPAEELIEIEYRQSLMKQGKIKYFGGKPEFLRRGYFDGVDLAFMVHASYDYAVRGGSVGCIAKTVYYKGVSAHAGGAPWSGVNALYAATQGLSAANALRETFPESDLIRFHPIITHGGEAVNAIPELVTVEAYVRGANFEAMKRANEKINRALCGAALSIGANVEIIDLPGYAPLSNDKNMIEVVKEAVALAIPEEPFSCSDTVSTGSTDMGDLSCIMPVVHPYSGGTEGTPHGADYMVSDPERACIKSAKMQMAMLLILLGDGARRAKKIIQDFTPLYKTKEEYFAMLDALHCQGERIVYKEGSAEVKL
ncbi:MAG: amidohydrolase [Clostridia bacterium]|nr:amidohydrolase [Clostridia bacterium]